jgi:glyoxylase-like metal-dependent hydrolase (beta-lactamase superfamily II)
MLVAIPVALDARSPALEGGWGGATAYAQPQTVADLVRVADDVYMFRMTGYNAMFIVTDEGVIATDPIGPTRAPLYKAAIAAVTDQPVRYVIYGHDHADHGSGGNVFADTAEFVSHWLAVPKIVARGDPSMPIPSITFDDFMTLTLGGKTVELHYVGLNHSDNNILVVYPAQRVAFGADFIEHEAVFASGVIRPQGQVVNGFRWLDDWIRGYRWIEENLDFDILIAGHGELGSKATFREAREYFEDLIAAVREARAAGLPDNSDAMISFVRERLAQRFGDWTNFDRRTASNVEGTILYLDGN